MSFPHRAKAVPGNAVQLLSQEGGTLLTDARSLDATWRDTLRPARSALETCSDPSPAADMQTRDVSTKSSGPAPTPKETQTESGDQPRHTRRLTDRKGGSNTRPYHAHSISGMNFSHLNSRVWSWKEASKSWLRMGHGYLGLDEKRWQRQHKKWSHGCAARQAGTPLGLVRCHGDRKASEKPAVSKAREQRTSSQEYGQKWDGFFWATDLVLGLMSTRDTLCSLAR